MDTWTQTSNCGCSRKNSVVASSAKSPHHHHHYHQHSNNNNSHHRSNTNNNNHHRSSSLRPLQRPVELDGHNAPGGDSGGSLSLASLQIRAVRAPTVVTSSVAPSDAALSPEAAHAAQGNPKDYPRGETASEFTAVAAGSTNTATHVCAGAGTTSDPSAAAGRQNDVRDCLQLPPRRGDLVLTRAVTDTIVTHGHFVSRRPAPGARLRKPPDGQQQQQQQQRGLRAGRERCWSGGVPPGGGVSGTSGGGGGGSVPSATRSRRGKSAGDGKHYCGRPCDACSLQQFQNWVKGKQLQDFDTGENQERMFIMDAKGWRRVSSLAEMPVTTVSVPGQGLPKLTGLKHELVDPGYYDRHRHVAEMETYERLRQRVRRRSLRGARLAKGSKPASVITNPAMEQHLRLGRKLLKEQENEKAFGEEALDDLLENILLYDVPGISKMRGDYTALLETQVSDSSDSDGRVLDVNASAALGGGTGNPSQPAPNAFLPSLLTGQRS